MAVSEAPKQADLDRCVHCGLCLNSCPTYRELGLEMDSPRGRIYQMVQVTTGKSEITPSYQEHIDLCLACRACKTACPSGVQYGRLVEAARAHIEETVERPWYITMMRQFVFGHLLQSPTMLKAAGYGLYAYQSSGLQRLIRSSGLLKSMGKLGELESLSPGAEPPFFFGEIGKVFPAEGQRKHRVAFLGGCIANVSFARLNEATIRVLQKNGCEVVVPAGQGCCGALHVHSGLKDMARDLARKNIDAVPADSFDAIITNAAGCGSTLKEYDELLENDSAYYEKAKQFIAKMKDITEFLGGLELNPKMGKLDTSITYQDSCHLAHGQKIRSAPRKLLNAVPGITFKEMPLSDLCCGSAGIYNVVHSEMASKLLENKMVYVNGTKAEWIVTANPGCMIQLQAGAVKHGSNQPVYHVVEVLDQAYRRFLEK